MSKTFKCILVGSASLVANAIVAKEYVVEGTEVYDKDLKKNIAVPICYTKDGDDFFHLAKIKKPSGEEYFAWKEIKNDYKEEYAKQLVAEKEALAAEKASK